MSVTSIIRRRGSTVTHYRPVYGPNLDGTRKVLSWTLVASSLRCLFEPISDERQRKAFGTVEVLDERGWIAGTRDVQAGDALVVTAGWRVGRAFRVIEPAAWHFRSANQHLELALQATTETIP